MDMALWTAKSGLTANHENLAIISNNLANANTAGFKKNRAEFEDLAYQVYREPGSPTSELTNSPNGIVLGTGVRLADNKKIFTEGSIVQTDSSLDVAINGRGFFQVLVPGQTDMAYTRGGSFQVNELGQLVLHSGYVIQPPIVIPTGTQTVSVSKDGIVSATVASAAGNLPQQIGQFEMVDFINPSGLLPVGENLYNQTVSSGTPLTGTAMLDGFGSLSQGSLESSNVNVVEEMVNLIEAQRTFEMSSKAVGAIDNMLQTLNRDI
ncbi:MAG: flagellar basal-body rod protein FlgG [Legionellales bacterium]